MKNPLVKIIGFVIGLAGFLLLFKLFALPHIPREDEVAPGLVVVAAVLTGLVIGFAGHLIQNLLLKKRR
ncbi:hypothetical protein [Spirosoma sp.]|uniref:hypothetical protein n=1 Tax=Spirosoma sp. TaxID=1899569 RepID=UPI003B39FB5A